MKKKLRLPNILLVLGVVLVSCNLPTQETGEGLSLTAAAQTIEALTSATPFGGISTSTITPIPGGFTVSTPSPTIPPATNTPVATATSNCNNAEFLADVTIPDGTIMTPNQAFTKTWRFRNVGACTWTPSYAIVFASGNSMNGPATQALTGNVNPGQTVDISVHLTAPGSTGNYTGYWKFRDGSGVLFDQFYVEIKVQSPATATNTLPPAIAQAVLTSIGGESGQVRSDGTILNPPNTGDLDSNAVAEAFVSFNMTSIPAGATITKVVVDFSSYDTLGNPWSLGNDGCLRAYVQNYGTLDAGDYFAGDPLSAVTRWCGAAELSSVFEDAGMKSAVQNAVGSSRLQLRIQFRMPTTNNNGVADMVRFGTVKLTVTYQ
jgi:hypothetical protein